MRFEEELERVLPRDIPHRERLIEKSARHLELIEAANAYMNLTRISTPTEAAIKHVLDSVLPWRYFEGAARVLDAGTGAGFPGVPLAIVLPEVRFVLSESIGKKARFVESVVETLDLANVEVSSERAEVLALRLRPDIVTARAVAPIDKFVDLCVKALQQGSRFLLYKGPDVAAELRDLNARRAFAKVLETFELPDGLGARTIVSVEPASPRKQASARRQ